MFGPTCTVPSLIASPGTPSSSDRSTSWPSASTSESASSVSSSPVGCGKPLASSAIFSTVSVPSSAMFLIVDSHLIKTPFLQRFLDFEVVRGHFFAGAPVDDDRFGCAQPLGRSRDVERGVAAAVHDDAPAEHRLFLTLHAAQHRHRIEHVRGFAGRDIGALGDMRADREERGVEAARLHRVEDIGDLAIELQFDAQVEDALDLGIEHVARQADTSGCRSASCRRRRGPASTILTLWPKRRR